MATPRFSFINYLACGSASFCSTSQDNVYTSTNLASPQRPFFPYHSASSSQAKRLVIDLGSTHQTDLIAAIRANFTTIRFKGTNTNTCAGWATPGYDSTNLTMTRNPYTGRYQILHAPTADFPYRFIGVEIPSQVTVKEEETESTAAAYFLIGGVWAGPSTGPASHLRIPVGMRTIEPRDDVGPSHDGWTQRLRLGKPRIRLVASRLVGVTSASPGLSDELDTTLALDQRMRERDLFLCDLNLGDPSQAWVVRRRSDLDWTLAGRTAEGPLELEEVTGP